MQHLIQKISFSLLLLHCLSSCFPSRSASTRGEDECLLNDCPADLAVPELAGSNLIATYDNTRVRCDYTKVNADQFMLNCSIIAKQSDGSELLARQIAKELKISWLEPEYQDMASVEDSCLASAEALSWQCLVRMTSSFSSAKVSIMLSQVGRPDAIRSELLLLPYGVGSVAGYIPGMSLYAPTVHSGDRTEAPSAGLLSNSKAGFQAKSFSVADIDLTEDANLCLTDDALYIKLQSQIVSCKWRDGKCLDDKLSLWAGSVSELTEFNREVSEVDRLSLGFGRFAVMKCSHQYVYLLDEGVLWKFSNQTTSAKKIIALPKTEGQDFAYRPPTIDGTAQEYVYDFDIFGQDEFAILASGVGVYSINLNDLPVERKLLHKFDLLRENVINAIGRNDKYFYLTSQARKVYEIVKQENGLKLRLKLGTYVGQYRTGLNGLKKIQVLADGNIVLSDFNHDYLEKIYLNKSPSIRSNVSLSKIFGIDPISDKIVYITNGRLMTYDFANAQVSARNFETRTGQMVTQIKDRKLGSSCGLGMDKFENIYFCDRYEAKILKINLDGSYSVIAGTGEQREDFSGFQEGMLAASFPLYFTKNSANKHMVVSSEGEVFILDAQAAKVFRIDKEGRMWTYFEDLLTLFELESFSNDDLIRRIQTFKLVGVQNQNVLLSLKNSAYQALKLFSINREGVARSVASASEALDNIVPTYDDKYFAIRSSGRRLPPGHEQYYQNIFGALDLTLLDIVFGPDLDAMAIIDRSIPGFLKFNKSVTDSQPKVQAFKYVRSDGSCAGSYFEGKAQQVNLNDSIFTSLSTLCFGRAEFVASSPGCLKSSDQKIGKFVYLFTQHFDSYDSNNIVKIEKPCR